MGSRTEVSGASADNPVIHMDKMLAEAEQLRTDFKAEQQAERLRVGEESMTRFAMLLQKIESSRKDVEELGGKIVNIESARDATAKRIEDVKISVETRIEQIDLSHEASTKRIEEVKTNVEVELSQETTIKLEIIKDLEDNVKIERAQEKREVQADDVLRGSLPKDPDILCKVLRGKTRSSLNGRVCTQKWRSAGSQSLHKNGRTSISRMSLDQKPQKGRQRQVSKSALMLEYRFVDKPP